MADPVTGEGPPEPTEAVFGGKQLRKEKRKALKKLKRKQIRKEAAIREKEEEEARLNDPEKQLRLRLREQEEAENSQRERRQFEERERLWLEAAAARKAREEEDERRKKLLEEEERKEKERACGLDDDDEYEYVEEGPAEIIWQGNEIIVKKKRVKVAKRSAEEVPDKEDDDRPTSNPLPPQSTAFSSHVQSQSVTAQEVFDNVTQQVPNFGTEQDKAHCPFHLKTGTCRFGSRCSRVHFYPEESCTLLIKNMYNGLGLSCEEDEGLEYTDEEVCHCYEEFYEDVHTEFLKFGEIVNFKVCKNSSYHLRGNVYVHYKSLESAILAYNTMSARYYAGKQIICEFVGVTRWKVAICGEYMKSRLKTCSHGSACNFIHSFRNPDEDYEWADWDNPPPKYWIKKMTALFGLSGESGYENKLESEDYRKHKDSKRTRKLRSHRCGRHNSGMYQYDEMEMNNSSSDGERLNSRNHQYKPHSITRKHSSRRQNSVSSDENEQLVENQRSKGHFYSKSFLPRSDEVGKGISKEENGVSSKKHGKYVADIPEDHRIQDRRRASEDSPSSRRKRDVYSGEQENPECNDVSKSHKKHIKKQLSSDQRKKHGRYVADIPEDHRIQDRRRASEDCPSSRRKRNVYSGEQENPGCNDMSKSHKQTLDSAHCRGTSHSRSNVESFSRHSIESQDQYNGRYSWGDVDSDKDSGEADSLSGKRRKYDKHSSQHQRNQQSHEHRYADKFRKGKRSNEKLSSDESPGRWKLSDGDSLVEESY